MEKRQHCTLLVEMQMFVATVDNSMEVSEKLKNRATKLPSNYTPLSPSICSVSHLLLGIMATIRSLIKPKIIKKKDQEVHLAPVRLICQNFVELPENQRHQQQGVQEIHGSYLDVRHHL